MSNSQEQTTIESLAARLAELEREHARIVEELAASREGAPRRSEGGTDTIAQKEATSMVGTPPEPHTILIPLDGAEGPTVFTGSGLLVNVVVSFGTDDATAIYALTETTHGNACIQAQCTGGPGLFSRSDHDDGVFGWGTAPQGIGVHGAGGGVAFFAARPGPVGVFGEGGAGIGVRGESQQGTAGSFENTGSDNSNPVIEVTTNGTGNGIQLTTTSGDGIVVNTSQGIAPDGSFIFGNGIVVTTTDGIAINATTLAGDGIVVNTTEGNGIAVNSENGLAISASSQTGSGIAVNTDRGEGISSFTNTGIAVRATSVSGTAIQAGSEFGTAIQARSDLGISLLVQGLIQVLGNSVGQATLPRGQTSVAVNTPAATPTSNILLTPLDNPRGQLWVTRAAGSFNIHVSAAPRQDVPIAYLIIN